MRAFLACLVIVMACTSGSKGGSPDAARSIDAAGSGSGSACTGATYDPCTVGVSGQCTSNNCHYYMQSNLTICTTTCDGTHPCPNDSAGNPVVCNGMGNCKPTVANTCTR